MDMKISSATCNSNVFKFSGFLHKALPTRIKYGKQNCRNLSIGTTSTPSTTSLPHPPTFPAFATPADVPQRSDEWFALRKDKLTTSTFSTALGFWKGARRSEL